MNFNRGELLKDLRIKKGFTLEEVGVYIGVTKQTLFKYENNIITNIPSDKIESLSRLYGVSPSVIMGWESPSTKIKKHVVEIEDILSSATYMTYGGKELSDKEKKQIRNILKTILEE
ncbi:helix-turn-helix domain-containing protein [Dialister pneumosintes]|uniref:HTH cro/C1-type domain-containing protein n=1 Tax=Dialister pneumosintes TaxID=39950 RepID=A0A1B3WCU2_9FIRM|nr:helix-turn-helix transcriptional regulator [Dialister pneumosintes]AOH38787.1 hypothetical protein BCB69_01595 [Dialister pneumosintes]